MQKILSAVTMIVLCAHILSACSSSILGPQISKTDPEGSDSSDPNTAAPTNSSQVSCERSSGQNFFLSGTTATLVFTCSTAVTSLTSTDTPSFFSESFSDTTVTFSGTASGEGTTEWSFNVNGQTTTSGADALSTTVISASSMQVTLTGTFAMASNNSTDVSFSLDLTLDNFWENYLTDISLAALSLDTDMHGLSISDSCTSATAPYVCHDTLDASSLAISRDMKINWSYSAFDQGNYTFAVNPRFTVGSDTLDLDVTNSKTFTIPIQTAGNIELSHTQANLLGAGSVFNEQKFPNGIAINKKSSEEAPIIGLTFAYEDSNRQVNAKRLLIDRTDDPSVASPDGVTQSGEIEVSNGKNSQYIVIKSLDNGDWVTVGAKQNTKFDVYFNKFSDSASLPASDPVGIDLTAIASGEIGAVAVSESFTDADDTERLAVGFIHTDGNDYLNIAKINPTGTDKSTIVDDSNFDTEASGSTNRFRLDTGLSGKVDRLALEQTSESSTVYFYAAYRAATDILVTKISAVYASGYGESTSTLTSGGLNDSGTGALQSLDMALGKQGGNTVVGVVYQKPGGHCYFRRINQDLSTTSQELDLTASDCYFPSIHYNAKSDVFSSPC
ncbi:MAG: hypothetical protein R3B45_13025 [Bdellovibrionota bacterium]